MTINLNKINDNTESRTYSTVDDMIKSWTDRDIELKKNHYWKWFFNKTIDKVEGVYDTVKSLYYNITTGIKNLIKWTPVIWKDRDFDYCYLLEIMKTKIKFMEYSMSHESYHVDADKTAKQMKIVIRLLDNLINDNYINHPNYTRLTEMRYTRYNIINFDILDTLEKRYNNCPDIVKRIQNLRNPPSYNLTDVQEQYDFDYLFKILKQNLRSWWT